MSADKSSELGTKEGGRSSSFMKQSGTKKRVSRSASFIKRMRLSFKRYVAAALPAIHKVPGLA